MVRNLSKVVPLVRLLRLHKIDYPNYQPDTAVNRGFRERPPGVSKHPPRTW